MLTPINFVPNGPPARTPGIRRLNLNRPLAIGAAFALWAVILIAFRLLTI
jgi:hypothetical protein